MASPAILYRGGELDSVTVFSGIASSQTGTAYYSATYSDMAINLSGNIVGESFRNTDGSLTNVSGGDVLWAMFFIHATSSTTGAFMTVYDENERAAIRLQVNSGAVFQLQHNTSSTGTPTWTTLSSFTGSSGSYSNYIVFRIKTGPSKEYSFFVDGNQVGSGLFINANMAALSRFTAGPASGNIHGISQIQFSRGVQLVGARVMTRKASGAGTYSQMAGAYTNLVKTSINDATSVMSDTAGQKSTFAYQDVTVPEGLEMHPDVWIWNRVKNDGAAPESIKQIGIIDSVEQESGPLPVSPGFQQLPAVFSGLTPEKWNSAEIGMESVDI